MSKHTPGPWRAGPNGGWGLGPINAVFTAESDLYGDLLASLQTVPESPHMEANALLMAAAPRMYQALKTARDCISQDRQALADAHMDPATNRLDEDGQAGVDEYDAVLAEIDAAIAQAEGQA
jgi:hypothetical protein